MDASTTPQEVTPASDLPYERLNAEFGLADSHRLAIEAIPAGARVLDIGCSSGYLAAALLGKGCATTGVDPDAGAARAAEAHCESVFVGNFESEELRARLPEGFDVVTMLDTLEHLRDPWDSLAFARTRLRPGGIAVISLPNIGVWFARLTLTRGRFPREDWGIFDRTHLRFFTREGIQELARSAGFAVASERPVPTVLPGEGLVRRLMTGHSDAVLGPQGTTERGGALRFAGRVREAAAAARPELFAQQFVLVLESA